MLFSAGIELPMGLDFTVVGVDAGSGSGQLIADGDRVILATDYRFSYATGSSPARTLQGQIDGTPVALIGGFWEASAGTGLLVSELRIGSNDLRPRYTSVRAQFEHGTAATAYRPEDGAARSPGNALALPALDTAQAMSLRFPDATGSATIQSDTPAVLEEFDIHLAALQDLLTIAEDTPIGRLRLEATDTAGVTVEIYGHDRFRAFGKPTRQPIEFLLRLGAEYAADVVDGWWRARADFRPVPQILAGILYQPGYIESTIIALAAIAQRTARTLLGVPDSRTYRQGLQAIIADLGPDLVAATKVDPAEWEDHLAWARNDIAHEGAPNSAAGVRYVTEEESRAVRDSTGVLLSLTIAKSLGVPSAVLDRAAERFAVRYSIRHWNTTIFHR